jgi:hypothetical protein
VKDIVAKNNENRYRKLEERKKRARGVGVDDCIVDRDQLAAPWPNEKKLSDR